MNLLKYKFNLWLAALHEASKCLALGARDTLSPSLLVRSAGFSIVASLLWIYVYVKFFSEISLTMAYFALISVMGMLASVFQGLAPHTGGSIVAMGNIPAGIVHAMPALFQIVQIFMLFAAIAVALYILLYLFAVTTTFSLVLPRFLMEKSKRHVIRHYPSHSGDTAAAPANALKKYLRISLILLLCLCIPLLAGLVLFLMLCYMNMRLMYSKAAHSMPSPAAEIQKLSHLWRPLLLLGIALMFLTAIPVFNLLVPGMMCTCVFHLIHRDFGEV